MTIHTDGRSRFAGTSRKGPPGEEICLDARGRYAGSKRKGILGEEHCFDADGHLTAVRRKSPSGTDIIVDRSGRYIGRTYKSLGSERITIPDGTDDPRPPRSAAAAWAGWSIALCVIAGLLILMLR